MFCPHCGSMIPDNSRFCSECGNTIDPYPAEEQGQSYQDAYQDQSYQDPYQQPYQEQPYQDAYQQQPYQEQPYQDAYQQQPYQEQAYSQYASDPGAQQSYSIQPTAPYGNQAASPNRIRTDREIAMYIILSIVTCGIYSYYFVYEMARDTNIMCANDGEETPGLAAFILLSIVTCGIYSYYWMYKLGNRLQQNGPRYGVTIADGGSDILLWLILGVFTCGICTYIGMHLLIKSMNTLATAYNNANGLG